ncbi:hypothetical protein GCM10027053_00870 [Intrasporangium mesophilum]
MESRWQASGSGRHTSKIRGTSSSVYDKDCALPHRLLDKLSHLVRVVALEDHVVAGVRRDELDVGSAWLPVDASDPHDVISINVSEIEQLADVDSGGPRSAYR